MRRNAAPMALALLLLLLPGAAGAEVTVEGHGWGHGVGLQQWGAYGYALREDRDARWILGHYYPGTTVSAGPAGARVRALIKRAGSAKLCSATRARGGRRSVALRATRCYRAAAWGGAGVALRDTTTGRLRARLQAPVSIGGGSGTVLRGRALNGRRDRSYRGVLRLLRYGRSIAVVDDVGLEHYLYGVVPAESPSSWPAAALQAQAVAARSYALRSLKPAAPFDVLPDTSAQVYGGIEEETPQTTAAVRATRRLVVKAGGQIATTFFAASSGGRTAAVEEGFPGAAPASYLLSVEDPYDELSPYHDWSVSFSDAQAERRLGDAVAGDLERVEVIARTPSDRALTVRVHGSSGDRDVTATVVRSRLDLRSTWFDFADERADSGRGAGR